MAISDNFSTDPGLNNKAPPLGAPEGGLPRKQISDTFRVVMAAIREVAEQAGGVIAAGFAAPGIIELATNAEVQAGTDDLRAVSPASLRACTATDSRKGVVELADGAEVIAGSDSARAVTPLGLAQLSATDVRRGLVELADGAEVITGTDGARVVTPLGLAQLTATTGRRGLVELATEGEAATGTDTARAVTPAGLMTRTAYATDTAAGISEFATTAEAFAGDLSRVASPGALAANTFKGAHNGFIKYPGGMVIQGGDSTTDTGGTQLITFPSQFANTVLSLQMTTFSAQNYIPRITIVSTSQFVMQMYTLVGAAAPGGVPFYWYAIGY